MAKAHNFYKPSFFKELDSSRLLNHRKRCQWIKIKGVGGVQLVMDEVGELNGFFQVYISAKTKANVLSCSDAKNMHDITFRR